MVIYPLLSIPNVDISTHILYNEKDYNRMEAPL